MARLLLLIGLAIYVTLGYIAVPILFKFLPPATAGEIAGVYLTIAHSVMAFTVLISWGLLWRYISTCQTAMLKWRFHLHFLMILLIEIVQLLIISPKMQAIKQQSFTQYGEVLSKASPLWRDFAQLHGLSQILFVVICLLVLKVWWMLARYEVKT